MTIQQTIVVVCVGAIALLALAFLPFNTPARAEKRVLQWARGAWLPRDDQAFAVAVRRHLRQVRLSSVGWLVGLLAGSAALLADVGLTGLAMCFAGAVAGQFIGERLASTGDLGGRLVRATGPRRRLRTRLKPAELVVLGIAPLAPVLTVVVGTATLGDPGVERKAVLAVVLGLAMLALYGAMLLAIRHALALESRAILESVRIWDEAHRDQIVRDLIMAMARVALPVALVIGPDFRNDGSAGLQWLDVLSISALLVVMGIMIAEVAVSTQPVRARFG